MIPVALPPVYRHTDTLLARAASPGVIRGTALRTWRSVRRDPTRAGFVLRNALRSAGDLRPWERRLLAAGLFALVRHHALLSAVLDRDDELGLWVAYLVLQGLDPQIAIEQGLSDPTALADLETAAQAVLRGQSLPQQLAIAGSLPPATCVRLAEDLGEGALPFIAACADRAPIVLRSPEPPSVAATKHPMVPNAWVLTERMDAFKLPEVQAGTAQVQDAGSQLLAASVSLPPQGRFLDACAGNGGKTLAVASAHPQALFYAEDTRKKALSTLKRRAGRSGTRVQTGSPGSFADIAFDAALVDAPCTGSGTLRREPERRWRLDPGTLPETQLTILQQTAERVRPGGQLVYATCSVFRVENEHVIERFLDAQPDWQATGPGRNLRPDLHDTDGFFWQVLTRTPR